MAWNVPSTGPDKVSMFRLLVLRAVEEFGAPVGDRGFLMFAETHCRWNQSPISVFHQVALDFRV